MTPRLASLLDSIKDEKKVSLAVADPKLGNAITKLPQLSISPVSDSSTNELYRAIRSHLPSLIPGLLPENVSTMSLGLSHSLSRHKLKFSPDKVDTMIIQAISLLDDLDKELNTYAMRVREWYGWHFPEVAKIINDNVAYSKVVLQMGMRTNSKDTDLAEILPEEIEGAVKAAAEISMGTEITEEDLDSIKSLAEQVVSFSEYRQQLASYLSNRMQAIAPNLTALVGELVGARLIAHAGSLMNLAKSPASTIQILGAEKALFRALKTKHDTPKYGLIFHASLVGQATGKNKGKIARMLAAKASLSLRVDTLSDWGTGGESKGVEPSEEEKRAIGLDARVRLEQRLRHLEGKPLGPRGAQIGPEGQQRNKWEIKEARKYNADADGLSREDLNGAMDVDQEPSGHLQNGVGGPKLVEEIVQNGVDEISGDESDGDSDSDSDEASEADVSTAEPLKQEEEKSEAKVKEKENESEKEKKKEKKKKKKEKGSEKEAGDSQSTSALDKKARREAKREAKLKRKAAKAEKRAKKLARKAAKEARLAKKSARKVSGAGQGLAEQNKKKRKREDGGGTKAEKRKKSKS